MVQSLFCWWMAWCRLPVLHSPGEKRCHIWAYFSFSRAQGAGRFYSSSQGAQEMPPGWPSPGGEASRAREQFPAGAEVPSSASPAGKWVAALAGVAVGTQKLLRSSVKATLPFHKRLLGFLWCPALWEQLKYCAMDMGFHPGTSQTLIPMLIQALAWCPPLFYVQRASLICLSLYKWAPKGTPTWRTREDFILF